MKGTNDNLKSNLKKSGKTFRALKKKLKKPHQNETWQWTPLFVLFNISKCGLSSFESTIFTHSINLPCSFTITYHCQHCPHILLCSQTAHVLNLDLSILTCLQYSHFHSLAKELIWKQNFHSFLPLFTLLV